MKIIKLIASLILVNIFHVNAFAITPTNAMVVSEQKIASQVGAAILKQGGNAIDAAVAVGYALAVVDPCCGNIGGGGFMTIRFADGKETVFDFREMAPLRATENMFVDANHQPLPEQSIKGYLAVAVPGTVKGLDAALQKYGTLSRQQVMAPAIKLANNGFIITPYEAKRYTKFAAEFRLQPNVAAIFMYQGKTLQPGFTLIQHDLAHSLTLIATYGPNAFYSGPIARAIVKASNQHGGILSLDDFKNYHINEVMPLHCQFRDYTIIAPPLPSSGVTLCEMLSILNHLPVTASSEIKIQSQATRNIIEAMRYGFEDRNNQLGDPHFVFNPTSQLLSPTYIQSISNRINQSSIPPAHRSLHFHKELTDTTHYSVVDGKGNAVSVTYTLNGFFGAGVIAGKTGFFLNDEMDDFTTARGFANKFGLIQSAANKIEPGKRPLSAMTPIIITHDDKLFMVLGSPGGPRIISSVLLTILHVIDKKMSLSQAINTPRFHYQALPDSIDIEPNAISDVVRTQMQTWGYHFTPQETWGAVEAIKVNPITNQLEGGNDYRRPDGGIANIEK